MKKEQPVRKFEEGIGDLETIVKQLETGDLPLEESLAAFEAGIGLVRELTEKVNAAEARVEVLNRSAGGELTTRPLEPEEEDADQL